LDPRPLRPEGRLGAVVCVMHCYPRWHSKAFVSSVGVPRRKFRRDSLPLCCSRREIIMTSRRRVVGILVGHGRMPTPLAFVAVSKIA